MLLLRALFLDLLLCLHVVGAAALFRRWFPSENPWFAFFVPVLGLLMLLNFLEHFVALTALGLLLPILSGGLFWVLLRLGSLWVGFRFPSLLFVATFSFLLFLKCLSPGIPSFSEGIGNLTRILNYSLGGTLPPIDSWLPPYPYDGYYSFQQYGAAILKRLYALDLGTSYNLGFAFLLAWTCLAGAAVAHALCGKIWITLVTVVVLLAGSSGSVPFLIFTGHSGDYALSTSLNTAFADPTRNPFTWFCRQDHDHPVLTLLAPLYSLWWSEFHATLGGSFINLAALLACVEVFKPTRTDWPWIGLIVLPGVVLITSAWFFIILVVFCIGSGGLALALGYRPRQWRFVAITGAFGLILVWPPVSALLEVPGSQSFFWTSPQDRTPWWMFVIQWWPIYLPWVALCFAWPRLGPVSRYLHAVVPCLLLLFEFVTFGSRSLTTEKMWGQLYGTGLVIFLPLVLLQRGWLFRLLGVGLLSFSFGCFGSWLWQVYYLPINRQDFCHLSGDAFIQNDQQMRRLVQELSLLHGATVLPGKSSWAYNLAPAIVTYSGNRCFVAYAYQEWQIGHGDEADYRNRLNNSFYEGSMPDPLPFLRSNGIAAVMIWPEDAIPEDRLRRFQEELSPDYAYVDCRAGGPHAAGVFLPLGGLTKFPVARARSATPPAEAVNRPVLPPR